MSDGTAAGTMQVADIRVGTSSSSPIDFFVSGTNLFFEANAGNGSEPFVYDGTNVTSLGDIRPGTSSSSPNNWVDLGGGRLLFTASDGTTAPGVGTELWTTNGTAAGTTLVRDINAGTSSSSPSWLTNIGGAALMTAFNTTNGRELWFSAGTAASTILFVDVEPLTTTGSSFPFWGSNTAARKSVDGSTLFMEADNGVIGDELWMLKNGTATLIKDINPGGTSDNGDPNEFTPFFNGTRTLTVFEADDGIVGDEPWVTDGTAAGTINLADLRPGTATTGSLPNDFEAFGQQVFFAANTGTTAPAGVGTELFVTDGTPGGTVLVKDIRPGTSSSSPDELTVFNGRLFFEANDGTNGFELWVSDGTTAGTVLFLDINPGSSSSFPGAFTEWNGKLYFRANNGTTGTELWVSDGTVAGTTLVADLRAGSLSSSPSNLTPCNGRLFFTANSGMGTELHVTDGTAAGTSMVADIYTGTSSSSPGDLTCSGNVLYFDAFVSSTVGGNGREIYKSDGTAAGTVLVKDIYAGGSSGSIDYPLAAGNGGLYFEAFNNIDGGELYYSDGTSAGTNIVCEGAPGSTSGSPLYMTYIGNKLVFRATSQTAGSELHELPTAGRAHAYTYGQGCGPAFGKLDATAPVLNSNSVISGSGPSGVPAAALLGFPQDAGPLVLSAPCASHINLLLPIVNLGAFATPTWTTNLAIPNDPGLFGGVVAVQAFYVYGSPILAASSNGVTLVIGD